MHKVGTPCINRTVQMLPASNPADSSIASICPPVLASPLLRGGVAVQRDMVRAYEAGTMRVKGSPSLASMLPICL